MGSPIEHQVSNGTSNHFNEKETTVMVTNLVMRNGHIFLARACPGMGPSGTGRLGQCPFGKFLARALTIGQWALNGHTL